MPARCAYVMVIRRLWDRAGCLSTSHPTTSYSPGGTGLPWLVELLPGLRVGLRLPRRQHQVGQHHGKHFIPRPPPHLAAILPHREVIDLGGGKRQPQRPLSPIGQRQGQDDLLPHPVNRLICLKRDG